ncbi:MAG: hypothetical protein VSS75_005425 [Candidatus Parabeggiatoa sp.]|nr:hypothetical protein [Candidatus Parabeggiatoa sp.]
MEIIPINTLTHSDTLTSMRQSMKQKHLLLWILPGCTEDKLFPLLELPWMTVWNDCPHLDFTQLWEKKVDKRKPLLVERPEQDPPDLRINEFLRVYHLHPLNNKKDGSIARRQARYSEQLRDKIEDYKTGIVTFVGSNLKTSWEKVVLTHDLAPNLQITLMTDDSIASPTEEEGEEEGIAYQWANSATDFLKEYHTLIADVEEPSVIDLKDAPGIVVEESLLEELSNYWTLLSRGLVLSSDVSQDDFDKFVSGEEIWSLYAAGAPYLRNKICQKLSQSSESAINFIEDVIETIRKFENTESEPTDQLRQFLLFSESGSGVTTLLRQTAITLAQRGYPTLIAKPFSRGFGGRVLEHFIVDVQDKWRKKRQGKGSGIGLLPVCLVLDTDAETFYRGSSLARQLSGLGRRVVLIRALERSQDELHKVSPDKSTQLNNVYTLPATVSKEELVELGKHLRQFCLQRQLADIPTEGEWRAYYEGLERLSRFSSSHFEENISISPLFLIGIYPFIKERISDQNSLEQYYYHKWTELNNSNIQELIRVLAVATAYGISIPYDTLRRHPNIDLSTLEKNDKESQRKMDTFIEWNMPISTRNWHLYMRHPAIGILLSRTIDPFEGDLPYSALLPLLQRLTTKAEDIWFAETLVFKLGRYFSSRSPRFSLETDTSIQKAARIIFNTIPLELKNISRTLRHHEGRYHVHVLQACSQVLNEPHLTTLKPEMVLKIAKGEYDFAQKELAHALNNSSDGEPDSNIYNTMALASFKLATILQNQNDNIFCREFKSALAFQEKAIISDPANGHALSQFVEKTLDMLGDKNEQKWSFEEKMEFVMQAESRLVELIRLHSEKRWRNIEQFDAEMQLGKIIDQHAKISKKLVGETKHFSSFKITHPETALFLKIRQTLGIHTLQQGFRQPQLAKELRQLREEFVALKEKSSRTLIYLYRLYLEDPVARLYFSERSKLLDQLRKQDVNQYLPFRHDEATLLCQLDKIDIGGRKFDELRASRQADSFQWLWLNEKVLLDEEGHLREMILTAHSSEQDTAYATIINTGIRVMYKPHQFSQTFSKGKPFKTYIRFTLNGLQAVPEKLAAFDLKEMGLA